MEIDILQIKIFQDGNQCCALIGPDLQAGRAGFGWTALKALRALCDDLEKNPWPLPHRIIGNE